MFPEQSTESICLAMGRKTAQHRLDEDQQSIEGAKSKVQSLHQDIERELAAMKVGNKSARLHVSCGVKGFTC